MQAAGTVTILRDGPLAIHSYCSPEIGEMVCSQIIETADRLVIVDAQLILPFAQEVRSYADRLGKPIDRVVISHAHGDHWMGLQAFADVPIYALAETKATLDQTADWFLDYKRSTLGDLIASEKVLPNRVLNEGIETIGGVRFKFSRVVDAESPAMALVELPDQKVLIAQDLVYNRIYLCVGEKNAAGQWLFDGWKACLRDLSTRGYDTVLAGHGEPTDSTIFPDQIAYIDEAQKSFEAGTPEDQHKQRLRERFPDWRLPEMLDFSNIFLYHRSW